MKNKPVGKSPYTVLNRICNLMPRAKHRRKKAAIKCHLSLSLQNHLPQAVCVERARAARQPIRPIPVQPLAGTPEL